jgi:diguanylate cyclase (GGDEF)-like protein
VTHVAGSAPLRVKRGGRMRRYVLLIVSVVVVAVLGAVAAWTQLDAASRVDRVHRADRVQQQRTLAGLTDQYLQFTFLSTQSAANAHDWQLTPGSSADARALRAIATSSPLTSYGAALVSLAGTPLSSYPTPDKLPPATDPGFAPLRRDLLAGHPGLSTAMDVAGTQVVAFAVPVMKAGHTAGLLVTFADIRTWPLQGYDVKLHMGPTALSEVVDSSGRIVAASNPALLGAHSTLPPAATTSKQGFVSYRSKDGTAMIASAGSAGMGWVAGTTQTASAFGGGLDASHQREMVALVLLLCLVVLLLVVFHYKRQQVLGRLADERLLDPLTGLPQRGVFELRMKAALARQRRDHTPIAVLYCDLDGFKAVNDGHGHNVGDQMLVAFGERLSKAVRDDDFVVRLGGDEFAVVLEGADAATAEQVAERMRRFVAAPLHINGREHAPRMSVGGAVLRAENRQSTYDDLLHEADLAMYRAKNSGAGCIIVTLGESGDSALDVTVPSQRSSAVAQPDA